MIAAPGIFEQLTHGVVKEAPVEPGGPVSLHRRHNQPAVVGDGEAGLRSAEWEHVAARHLQAIREGQRKVGGESFFVNLCSGFENPGRCKNGGRQQADRNRQPH